MAHVDALSRIVHYISLMPLEKKLQYRQLQDIYLKSLADKLESSNNDNNF